MKRLKIIFSMLGRGIVYGALLGSLAGFIISLPFAIFGGLVGVRFGFFVGIGIGILTGLIVGIITTLFFYPLKNTKQYQRFIMLICSALATLLATFASQWFWTGRLNLNLPGPWPLLVPIGIVTGLACGKWLTTPYIQTYQMPEAPVKNERGQINDMPPL